MSMTPCIFCEMNYIITSFIRLGVHGLRAPLDTLLLAEKTWKPCT